MTKNRRLALTRLKRSGQLFVDSRGIGQEQEVIAGALVASDATLAHTDLAP